LSLGRDVAAQIERQTNATEPRRFARAHEILLLAPAPPVNEETAGHGGRRREQCAGDMLVADRDVHAFKTRFHTAQPGCTW